jgi:hypothetical protein
MHFEVACLNMLHVFWKCSAPVFGGPNQVPVLMPEAIDFVGASPQAQFQSE